MRAISSGNYYTLFEMSKEEYAIVYRNWTEIEEKLKKISLIGVIRPRREEEWQLEIKTAPKTFWNKVLKVLLGNETFRLAYLDNFVVYLNKAYGLTVECFEYFFTRKVYPR